MKNTVLYFMFLILISCGQQKKSSENTTNPVEEINWIKEYIAATTKSPFPTKVVITQYTYKNQNVYLVNGCYNCADAVSYLYTSNKEQLCTFGGMIPNSNNCPDFFNEATDKKVIWKSF